MKLRFVAKLYILYLRTLVSGWVDHAHLMEGIFRVFNDSGFWQLCIISSRAKKLSLAG